MVKEQDEEAGNVEELVVTDSEFSEEGGLAGRTHCGKFSNKRAPGSHVEGEGRRSARKGIKPTSDPLYGKGFVSAPPKVSSSTPLQRPRE